MKSNYIFCLTGSTGLTRFFLFFLTFWMKVGITDRLPGAEFVFMCAPVQQEISEI
jgi:hypothetical protein